jgi:NAD(P)-dependent dehydrogenase (short-subunit alcohol dehydrogenase family)
MAVRFAKLGCNLVLWDVNREGNEQTALEVKEHGVMAHAYVVDLSSRDDTYKVAEQVSELVTCYRLLQCTCVKYSGDINPSRMVSGSTGFV